MSGSGSPDAVDARTARPVAVFSLGWTLLNGQSLRHLARRFCSWEQAREIVSSGDEEDHRDAAVRDLARLMEGVPIERVEAAVSEVFIRPQGGDAVRDLQRDGFSVGVASTTFHPATERARRALKLDFAVGVPVETTPEGVITGRLGESGYSRSGCELLCKRAVLEEQRAACAAPLTVAIGHGNDDVCMLEAADLGIAIERAGEAARQAADLVAELSDVPEIVNDRVQALGIELVERR